jgi:hypothetical protein
VRADLLAVDRLHADPVQFELAALVAQDAHQAPSPDTHMQPRQRGLHPTAYEMPTGHNDAGPSVAGPRSGAGVP